MNNNYTRMLNALNSIRLSSGRPDLEALADILARPKSHDPKQQISITLPSGAQRSLEIEWRSPSQFPVSDPRAVPTWLNGRREIPGRIIKTLRVSTSNVVHIIIPLARLLDPNIEAEDRGSFYLAYSLDLSEFMMISCYDVFEFSFDNLVDLPDRSVPYDRFPGTDLKVTVGVLHFAFTRPSARLEVLSKDRFVITEASLVQGQINAIVFDRGLMDIIERPPNPEYRGNVGEEEAREAVETTEEEAPDVLLRAVEEQGF